MLPANSDAKATPIASAVDQAVPATRHTGIATHENAIAAVISPAPVFSRSDTRKPASKAVGTSGTRKDQRMPAGASQSAAPPAAKAIAPVVSTQIPARDA